MTPTPTPAASTTPTAYDKPYRPGAAAAVAAAQLKLQQASRRTPAQSRVVAILHNAAMDLWDVATEEDPAQAWEEARAIDGRLSSGSPVARRFRRCSFLLPV